MNDVIETNNNTAKIKTYTKSASDFTNRMRGKSSKHIIEVISKPSKMAKND